MYHSITFIDTDISNYGVSKKTFNTWDDWYLIPTSRPVFNPPSQKTMAVDIPGADSILDLSESLTKYPIYNNRIGSFEFIVENDHEDWKDLYTRIANQLHGRRMIAILEDDPAYYYEGRFTINNWKSNNNGTWSNITIDYNVYPYKLHLWSSTDDWLWDPFNFDRDMILSSLFTNLTIGGNTTTNQRITEISTYNEPATITDIVVPINSSAINGILSRYTKTSLYVTGKNLLDLSTAEYSTDVTKVDDTFQMVANNIDNPYVRFSFEHLPLGSDITVSFDVSAVVSNIDLMISVFGTEKNVTIGKRKQHFSYTTKLDETNNSYLLLKRTRTQSNATIDNAVLTISNIQAEIGSEDTDYEEYSGHVYTYTPPDGEEMLDGTYDFISGEYVGTNVILNYINATNSNEILTAVATGLSASVSDESITLSMSGDYDILGRIGSDESLSLVATAERSLTGTAQTISLTTGTTYIWAINTLASDIHNNVDDNDQQMYHVVQPRTSVSSTSYEIGYSDEIGRRPVCPVFTIESDGDVTIRLINEELETDISGTFRSGTSRSSDFVMTNLNGVNNNWLIFSGSGTVSIMIRNGEL